jgi:hypothetical protein
MKRIFLTVLAATSAVAGCGQGAQSHVGAKGGLAGKADEADVAGTIHFTRDLWGGPSVTGALVAGTQAGIQYDPDRMADIFPECVVNDEGGVRQIFVSMGAIFDDSGNTDVWLDRKIFDSRSDFGSSFNDTVELALPPSLQKLALYFSCRTPGGQSAETRYDSNWGANFQFAVAGAQ